MRCGALDWVTYDCQHMAMHTEWSDLEPDSDTARRWFPLEFLVAALPVGLGFISLATLVWSFVYVT